MSSRGRDLKATSVLAILVAAILGALWGVERGRYDQKVLELEASEESLELARDSVDMLQLARDHLDSARQADTLRLVGSIDSLTRGIEFWRDRYETVEPEVIRILDTLPVEHRIVIESAIEALENEAQGCSLTLVDCQLLASTRLQMIVARDSTIAEERRMSEQWEQQARRATDLVRGRSQIQVVAHAGGCVAGGWGIADQSLLPALLGFGACLLLR